jgi:mRNA-degrading endonuclease RelE of RelBE toxin-antitoxin system
LDGVLEQAEVKELISYVDDVLKILPDSTKIPEIKWEYYIKKIHASIKNKLSQLDLAKAYNDVVETTKTAITNQLEPIMQDEKVQELKELADNLHKKVGNCLQMLADNLHKKVGSCLQMLADTIQKKVGNCLQMLADKLQKQVGNCLQMLADNIQKQVGKCLQMLAENLQKQVGNCLQMLADNIQKKVGTVSKC